LFEFFIACQMNSIEYGVYYFIIIIIIIIIIIMLDLNFRYTLYAL
jgi:hypothetical protein